MPTRAPRRARRPVVPVAPPEPQAAPRRICMEARGSGLQLGEVGCVQGDRRTRPQRAVASSELGGSTRHPSRHRARTPRGQEAAVDVVDVAIRRRPRCEAARRARERGAAPRCRGARPRFDGPPRCTSGASSCSSTSPLGHSSTTKAAWTDAGPSSTVHRVRRSPSSNVPAAGATRRAAAASPAPRRRAQPRRAHRPVEHRGQVARAFGGDRDVVVGSTARPAGRLYPGAARPVRVVHARVTVKGPSSPTSPRPRSHVADGFAVRARLVVQDPQSAMPDGDDHGRATVGPSQMGEPMA